MRDIKFRAWCKNKKTMLEWGDILLNPKQEDLSGFVIREHDGCTEGIVMCSLRYALSKKSKYTVMQYTGLKDKNGKEIYEGDIVEFSIFCPEESRKKDVVKFRNGMFTAIGLSEIEERKVNVIGNKYESPNLIK